MIILWIYKTNPTSIDVANLVEEIIKVGLGDVMQKHHDKPLEKEAKSIVTELASYSS